MVIRNIVAFSAMALLSLAIACSTAPVADRGAPTVAPAVDPTATAARTPTVSAMNGSIPPARTPAVSPVNDSEPSATPPRPSSETWIWQRPRGPVAEAGELIVVKFAEGMVVRISNGNLVSLGGQDITALRAAFERYPVIDVRPLFSRDVPELEAERQRAQQRTGVTAPDLTLFFVVTLARGAPEQAFVGSLTQLDTIERAYVAPKPAPPPGG